MTDLVEQLLNEEEGVRACVYADSRGFWTIARGVCVDERVDGAGLPQAAIDAANAVRTQEAVQRAEDLPGYQRCNEVRRAVCVSICFQLGTMAEWHQFRAGMAAGNYDYAADALLYRDADDKSKGPSDFHRETPKRAEREAKMLASGQWVDQE